MKTLYYTLSYFHKAVKRNKPDKVYYDDFSDEFWFFTQKAIINYASENSRVALQLRKWLKENGVLSVKFSR